MVCVCRHERHRSNFEAHQELVGVLQEVEHSLQWPAAVLLNAMVKSVNERRREIGTLRSLGFKQNRLTRIFSTEGVVIGVIGSILGSVFCIISSLILNKFEFIYFAGFLSDPVPFVIGLVPNLYLLSLVILCAIAATTAFFASYRAVKSSIPTLLTSV
jgi:ABC-type antimicrobial peptide transport system permease subunit